MDADALKAAAKKFSHKYDVDVSEEHSCSKFRRKQPSPLLLLNNITTFELDTLFATIVIPSKIFCTLAVVSKTSGEVFQLLSSHRSLSDQKTVSGLATLAMEWELARRCDFNTLIVTFAAAKARKAPLNW